MGNKFQITISAVDRATAVVRRINGNLSQLTRPVVQLGQSIRSLARETGVDRLGRDLVGVGRAVTDVGGKVSGLLGPLGLLVGGGILAGLVALTLEWSHLGAEVSRTARGLDMSVGELQSLRGAASLAGVGVQELTGGLKSVGDTLEDALFGRNQQALVVLNRLGVGIHHTADGSIDAARGMRDLSSAIASIKNVQVQGLIARTFGLEALLPLLRQGPAAIAAYEEKVAQLGGVMSGQAVAAAGQFQLSLNYLNASVQGVRNAIGARLLPVLQPLVDRFTGWIAVNRELIATKVVEFVEGLVQRVNELDFQKIGNDMHDFVDAVESAVQWMGGWKNAAIGLVVIMNGSLIASVINLGLALGRVGLTAIPVLIRGFGLLAAATDATLVPAVLKGLLSAGLYTAGLAEMAAGIPVLGTALAGLSSAFLAVGAAIAATPVGWIIAGIAAIAFGVYAIYKNWDAIGAYFTRKIADVKAAFDRGWLNGIVKLLQAFNPTTIIGDALNGLSKWLFNFDLYEAGSRVIGGLVRGMKGAVGLLPKSVLKFLGIEDWAKPKATGPAQKPAAAARSATQAPAPAQKPAAAAARAATQASTPASATPAAPRPAPATRAVQTSAQVPMGIRNNNPGNLRQWGDTPRDSKGYAVFSTMDAGLTAAVRNLLVQQQLHGLNTIRGIVSKWAPPGENDTAAYISDLAKRSGFGADQALNLQDPKVVAPLISGIVRHEGNSAGVTDEMINNAVAAQLGGNAAGSKAGPQKVEVALTLHGLPSGTSATARTRDGDVMPVRVAYSMPTGVTP